MAYSKESKYLRHSVSNREEAAEAKETDSKNKKPEYRSSVMTPKRARELAEAAEAAALEGESTTPETAASEETTAEEPSYKTTYRSSVITPKRAKELAQEAEAAPDKPEEDGEPVHRKGTDADMFRGKQNDVQKEITYGAASAAETDKIARHRATVRMAVAIAVCAVFTCLLQLFLKLHVPFTPDLFTVEFSAVPELIVTVAYGPLFGLLLCFIKNLVQVLIVPTSLITAATNLVTQGCFLLITGLLYDRLMSHHGKKRAKKRTKMRRFHAGKMLLSALVGALLSLVPQFFMTNYVAYPLMEHFYSDRGFTLASLLTDYQTGVTGLRGHLPSTVGALVPDITSIARGVVFVNLPITLAKLLIVTLLTVLLLLLFLPFLQYRDKKAKQQSASHRGRLETLENRK